MKISAALLLGLLLASTSVYALSRNEIKAIIQQSHAGAVIGEIDKDKRNGAKVYEVDFVYQELKYEAVISADGEVLEIKRDLE